MSDAEFQALLESPEGSRVEFKSASGGFEFENLAKYCVALANEGGGAIVRGSHRIGGRQEGGEVAPEMITFHEKVFCISRRIGANLVQSWCKSAIIPAEIYGK